MLEPLPELTDYPAAHSMDTAWFAVDANGHIGSFRTGEAGALPISDVGPDDIEMIFRRLWTQLPATNVIHDRRGHYLPNADRSWRGEEIQTGYGALIFVASLEPFADDIRTKRIDVFPAVEGHALQWSAITPEEAERVQESGVLLGWDYHFGYDEEPEIGHLALRGVFEYTHLAENWTAGPYGRLRLPDVPAHIDQLEPRLRNIINLVQLPEVSFANGASFNPAKYVPCHAWDYSGWEDVDGKSHPFPGHDDEFQARDDDSEEA